MLLENRRGMCSSETNYWTLCAVICNIVRSQFPVCIRLITKSRRISHRKLIVNNIQLAVFLVSYILSIFFSNKILQQTFYDAVFAMALVFWVVLHNHQEPTNKMSFQSQIRLDSTKDGCTNSLINWYQVDDESIQIHFDWKFK